MASKSPDWFICGTALPSVGYFKINRFAGMPMSAETHICQVPSLRQPGANPYLPYPVVVERVVEETSDHQLKSIYLRFTDEADRAAFQYRPGQFAELSLDGHGEIPIGIASAPTDGPLLRFTVNKTGKVSSAVHNLEPGQFMGVRGPLGNSFPLEAMEGHNIILIGGGFAFTTLRAFTAWALDPANRSRYGDLTVIYGAREPGLLLYREELDQWEKRPDLRLIQTIDKPAPGWTRNVGFVPTAVKEAGLNSANAYAIVCGPPIMIKFTLPVLDQLGFPPDRVLLSLEMRMKCGVGICGRCNIGSQYVCKDGPVFTMAQLRQLPNEY